MNDTKAYTEGCAAYNAGNGRDANPYPASSQDRRDWLAGFNFTQDADMAS